MIAASKNQSWEDLHKYFSHVIDGIGTPIDAGIIDVVVGLNAVGVNTEASCEGHLDHGNAHPWIRIGALGVDDLEEEFRQARLRLQRASESNHDQAFAEYIEPGAVNTEFVASVQASMAESTQELQKVYSPMLDTYLNTTRQVFATIGQTPEDIGHVIVEAATADTPHFRYTTSDLMRGLVSRKYVDPTGDSIVALSGARLP